MKLITGPVFLPTRIYCLFSFLLITLLSGSCKKENMCDCFKSTGSEKTESRNLAGFTKIELHNNVDLVITPGKPFAVSVTAGKNLIDLVTTEVEDNTLIIRNKNKCNWVRSFQNKFTVQLSIPELTYIYYDGSGHITTTDTLNEPFFTFEGWTCSGSVNLLLNTGTSRLTLHTGTADLTASGFAGVSYVYSSAAGPMQCSKLETGYTYITNAGTNECYVRVTKEMAAVISLQGNIYYSGNPYKVEKEITGTGQLIGQ